jgi:type IV pilus assembly protein PilM
MAKTGAVWGIDIGQCALKAMRCRPHDKDENRLVVEAFDYIEYPKILTQPEANREELIREALEQFVSRNDVAGDRVAIAVPGQSGLARFIKLPPVERKKIPDIVKYEARQQIPFALEDVVWDYQPLVGSEEEGYAIETEVGLFAMKRDQVARALKPLEDAGIPVDIIQLAPLSIYNFICFDRLNLSGAYDPANPPQSTVIISLGTDTTDLVITNGYRVWQRSIPIGGNHFTKALTKELKLTFAKAEHLKRNAMKAENPKAVFQAMRPVFSDLVAEIQRSIGFFTSNNRNAKLGDMVALGNPMKLPGLQRFLSQNLDQEVKLVDQFNNLVGGTATAGPQFKENQLTFGVAYGLCVQALDSAQLRTNLLPEEIITTRLVRAKKPWAVAAVAMLLLGMTISYFGHYSSLMTANVADPAMDGAIKSAASVKSTATEFTTSNTELTTKFDQITTIGNNLQSNVDGRLLWLELLKAVDAALPKDTRPPEQRKETAEDIALRPELHIESMDCEYFTDVSQWKNIVNPAPPGKPLYISMKPRPAAPAAAPLPVDGQDGAAATDGQPVDGAATDPAAPATPADGATPAGESAADAAAPDAAAPADETAPDAGAEAVPAEASGEAAVDPATGQPIAGAGTDGWVIELRGYHLHNALPGQNTAVADGEGGQFVLNTLIKNLETGTVKLPDGENGALVDVPIADLGIELPTLVTREKTNTVEYLGESVDLTAGAVPNIPVAAPASPELGPGGVPGGPAPPKTFKLRRYRFIVQFSWQPKPRGKRLEKMAQQKGAAPSTAAVEAEPPAAGPSS